MSASLTDVCGMAGGVLSIFTAMTGLPAVPGRPVSEWRAGGTGAGVVADTDGVGDADTGDVSEGLADPEASGDVLTTGFAPPVHAASAARQTAEIVVAAERRTRMKRAS
jgi:hypothetical protein